MINFMLCIFYHNKNHLKKTQQVRINKIIWGGGEEYLITDVVKELPVQGGEKAD